MLFWSCVGHLCSRKARVQYERRKDYVTMLIPHHFMSLRHVFLSNSEWVSFLRGVQQQTSSIFHLDELCRQGPQLLEVKMSQPMVPQWLGVNFSPTHRKIPRENFSNNCHGQTKTARGRCFATWWPGSMGLTSASLEACEVFSRFEGSASRIRSGDGPFLPSGNDSGCFWLEKWP